MNRSHSEKFQWTILWKTSCFSNKKGKKKKKKKKDRDPTISAVTNIRTRFYIQIREYPSTRILAAALWVRALTDAPQCVLEQDTYPLLSTDLINPGRPVPTWLKNCWFGCKESSQTKHKYFECSIVNIFLLIKKKIMFLSMHVQLSSGQRSKLWPGPLSMSTVPHLSLWGSYKAEHMCRMTWTFPAQMQ